jgi:solute carrier family 45 protein 3
MSFSVIMDRLTERFSARCLWTVSLFVFVLCTTAMMLVNDVTCHFVLIAATGPLYACINALPIAVISEYHNDQSLYFGPNRNSSRAASAQSSESGANHVDVPEMTQPRGMGSDMAILDSAYFLSQVFITTSLGYLSHWTGSVYSYIIFANVTSLLSILTLKNVVFNASEMMMMV